jgi:hypothetical protein
MHRREQVPANVFGQKNRLPGTYTKRSQAGDKRMTPKTEIADCIDLLETG